jgi:hypothetical protein
MAQAGRDAPGLARGQLNTHLLLQPIVTLGEDGATAHAAWHEFAMLGNLRASAGFAGGVYENDYVREKGVWKISRLRFFQQYAGAYADWGHRAPPHWNIPYHFQAPHVGVTIPAAAVQPGAAVRGVAARSETVERRIQRLEDETAVANLQHSYGYYVDRKLWDDAADLFADSGSFEMAARGASQGRPDIRHALETLYGAGPLQRGELFEHLQFDTLVTLAADGRSAWVRSLQLSMLGRNGEYARWETGVYENAFIKQDGVWKIAALHYYPRMATDYDRGWAEDNAFPDIRYVAFHAANPATGRPVRIPAKAQIAQRGDAVPHPAAGAAPAPTLASLQRRLDATIAVDAVENLNSSYGYYIDESAWDAMADTFASVGSKEITGAGVYVGPEHIRKVLNLRGPRGGRTPGFFTIHQLTQPVIHVAADGNSARARLRLFQCGGSADGSSGSWIGGIYENTAVKENGEWKFGVQELHHAFNASYRNGWARVGTVDQLPATSGAGGSSRVWAAQHPVRVWPPSSRLIGPSLRVSMRFRKSWNRRFIT